MAIAHYASTTVTTNSTSVDGGTGTYRAIIFVANADTADNMTAVTWGGESLTKLNSLVSVNTRYDYIWYLLNPTATGSQTLAVTGPGGYGNATCQVYTGVSAIKNFNSATGNSTAPAVSITANDGDWLVGGAESTASNVAAGSNTTRRSSASSTVQGDSNGAASPTALNWTASSGTWTAFGCAITPKIESSVSDSTTSTDSVVLSTSMFVSDSSTSVDSISYPDWINRQKNTTTWTNQTKS